MWILLSSLGWAIVIASVFSHLALLIRAVEVASLGNDMISFQCSGHVRAYLIMVAVMYMFLLGYHLI